MTDWQAQVGDEVTVESHRLRGMRRAGTILEVLGAPGREYYRVCWQDGRETVFHPGSDAAVRSARPAPRAPVPSPAAKRPKSRKTPEPSPQPLLAVARGDRLVIRGHHLGEPDRDAEILEVLGKDGGPPYRVRWGDTGRETMLFPGTDAVVEHFPRRRRRSGTAKE